MQLAQTLTLQSPALACPARCFQSRVRPQLLAQRALLSAQPTTKGLRSGRLSAYVLQTVELRDHDAYLDDQLTSSELASAVEHIPSAVERLRHSLVTSIAVGLRFVRFAAAWIRSGALQAWLAQVYSQQLAQHQKRRLVAQQQAAEELARQTSLRAVAEARMGAAAQQVSDAQRAFCRMILRQDNPERSLEDKWADLRAHMHGEGDQQFRHVTEQLFTSACVSCANVQAALTASDPACSTAALNRLVEQHTCVQQEEALRSMLFAQLLAAQQQ